MDTIISYAYDYTLRLGISPSVSGFEKFVKAVAAYADARDFPPLENVCAAIGNPGTVMHAISYALKSTHNICDKLYELTDIMVRPEDIRPKYVICLIAGCIKRDLHDAIRQ